MLVRSTIRAASTSASGASSSSALSAYLLLSRPPTVLRSPSPFESAYHAYNSKLQSALSQPFPREIYFKKGSAAEKTFLKEEKERKDAILKKSQRDGESVTSDSASEEKSVDSSAEKVGSNQGLYSTLSRRTKADDQGSIESLERSLDRHLFLLVKGGEMGNDWTLPFAKVEKSGSEALHKAAPKAVHKLLGDELDIWMVTNLPVGVISNSSEKAYIMKGHILSGQPQSSSKEVQFAWLTREEIQERMHQDQWKGIRDLLCA